MRRSGRKPTSPPRSPARTGKASPDRQVAAPSNAPPFLVAAVGASAGGLEAFSMLLRGLAGAPLAVVLAQHTGDDQQSILPELLDKATDFKVALSADNVALSPGHVYVIPPDSRMTVSDGHLRVRPWSSDAAVEGAVDILFRSVATEYKERGIGIILSGSGQDGAAGIREIKGAGGITLAQKPEEAAVDGMPRAAIATGHVDSVLPTDELAELLARLAQEPFFFRDESGALRDSQELGHMTRTFHLLLRNTGIDFSKYKLPTVKRRIERRIALRRLSGLGEYVRLLADEPQEVQRLQEDLLIHVTSFFRDPPSYAALGEVVFPRLFADTNSERPVRFWIPGCSTGEEVYSLAMVVLEYLDQKAATVPLQIFGTDVSEVTVAKARTGIYPSAITADVSPQRLRRFFSKVDGGDYRINKEVRDRCVFARQDVTRDPPFSRLDLILCRNLLIYLNQTTQHKVLNIFHYALRRRGVLVLGPSETVGPQVELFAPLEKQSPFFIKKAESEPPELDFVPSPPPPAVASIRPDRLTQPALPATGWDAQNEANRFMLDRYAPPAVVVNRDLRIIRARGSTAAFLELGAGEVSLDILKMVRPGLAFALRAALTEARACGAPVTKPGLKFNFEGEVRVVALQVAPLGAADSGNFLVLFEDSSRAGLSRKPAVKKASREAEASSQSTRGLELELTDTRNQLQSIIDDLAAANEELQTANEEILSSNEELQSTNEELDTAKEELQSTNEELNTLNDEFRGRNEELSVANGDLSNLLNSVQIPIVMVTQDLRLRRVTPAAEKILNIIPSDLGRPIGHLNLNFLHDGLDSVIREAIDTVTVKEQEVTGKDGRSFLLQIRPYKSVDYRIDGAMVVLFDFSSFRDRSPPGPDSSIRPGG